MTDTLSSVPERLPGALRCHRGQHWRWDGVAFRVLWPPVQAPPTGNDGSCVVRVRTASGATLLLTGDIQARAERALLTHGVADLRALALTVPHHGSETSSTPAFVRAVAARYALFPVGYRNRFRLPSSRVQARYAAAGARVLRTDREGAVMLRVEAAAPVARVRSVYRSARRYWWSAPVPRDAPGRHAPLP